MNITPDQLMAEIGRLHVANQLLSEQLAASRAQLVKMATDQAAELSRLDESNEDD